MNLNPFPPRTRARPAPGFTLIELMIVVVVVALLAAVALPSYQASVRKGRRAEAFTALSQLQQAQERWRSNNASYTATLASLGVEANTASGLYALSVSNESSTGYTVTATATAGTSQARDGDCKRLGVKMTSGNLKYGSGDAAIDWAAGNPDAGACWAR